jgi:hypothetical protein
MWKRVLLVLFGVTAGTTPASSAEIPRAALEAWASYRTNLAKRGFVIEQSGTTNGKPAGSTVYRWSAAGASLQTDNKALAKRGLVAYVRNPDYAFQVTKDSDASWVLKDLLLGASDAENPTIPELLTRDAAMPGLWGLLVESVLLPDAIEDGLISVESTLEKSDLGTTLVEITIRGDSRQQVGFSVDRGTVTLAPKFSWMIKEARLDLVTDKGRKGTLACERTYTSDSSKIFISQSMTSNTPLLIREQGTLTWEGGKPITHDLTFDWKEEVPQDSQFRLTHYGLSEPAVLSGRWTRRVFLIAMYVAAIILAVALLLRRRRHSSASRAH